MLYTPFRSPDFLVARGAYPETFVAVSQVTAAGEVQERTVLTDGSNPAYVPMSLASRDGTYLLGYGDTTPCQILCPPSTTHAWVRALAKTGEPLLPEVTVASGEDFGPAVVGSTADASVVTWMNRAGFSASFVGVDGKPEGEPFDFSFDVWGLGTSIAADQGRFYLPVSMGLTRAGFLALAPNGSQAVAFPVDGPWLAGLGVEGSSQPRLIVSESQSLGVSRLLVQPATMSGAEVSLRVTIEGLPSEVTESTEQEIVVSFWNDGDTPATGAVASTSLATLLDDDGGACITNSYEISCSWPRIEPHALHWIKLRLHVPRYSSNATAFEFRATVASRELDRDAIDNAARREVRIVPRPRSRPLRR